MKRIRKGDEVIVIAGKAENKGQRGTMIMSLLMVLIMFLSMLSQIVNCRRKAQS